MKRFYMAAALAILAMLPLAPARAQSADKKVAPYNIKIGLFRPTKGDVRTVGNTWFIGGLDYTLGNPEAAAVNSIEGLYLSKSGSRVQQGLQDIPTRFRTYSFAFNHKIRRIGEGGITLGNVFYYGAGLGVDFNRVTVNDQNPGGEGNIKTTRAAAAANVFLGEEVAENFNVELRYHFQFGTVAGRKIDGPLVLAGFRF